ncbi:universal stress protein [Azospirillum thermophilum]|uniref:Universal stress protein n=1 Tax=Azospirillum thermophilum TaxID=2202148 RepID=A0A2S2CVG5_9PROT|nr:universal stress protein [Azospirillum thermophilum]AWK88277.1 universal stress protein [Azospirillum thermophilum]
MTPKDIVVFIEEEEGLVNRLSYATALAERWQAHLTATFVAGRLDLHHASGFARGAGVGAMLRKHQASVRDAETWAKTVFETLTQRAGIPAEWRVSENEDGEALMLHARHACLAIVGPPDRPKELRRLLSLSEDVIFASGRPSLLLPRDWPSDRIGRRIVVGWNGSREAANAIGNALPFLVAAEAVHLVVVPAATLQASLGAEPGADMTRHLVRNGVEVVLEQCPGTDAGAVLLDRARALDADMLVMGAYGRSKISEFVFGGATRTVLANAGLPILLSR